MVDVLIELVFNYSRIHSCSVGHIDLTGFENLSGLLMQLHLITEDFE
jgi:hypothetical protein